MTDLIDAIGSRIAAALWFMQAARMRPRCGDLIPMSSEDWDSLLAEGSR